VAPKCGLDRARQRLVRRNQLAHEGQDRDGRSQRRRGRERAGRLRRAAAFQRINPTQRFLRTDRARRTFNIVMVVLLAGSVVLIVL
jgi:hypothetical protein